MSDTRTAFEALLRTNSIPLQNAWRLAFEEAEQILLAAHPEGVDVLEIGRLAWESLHPDLKNEALDALVYGWWEAEQDRQVRTEQADEDDAHPAPCWYPYHKPCTCFGGAA